jgi:hypothetical protein
MAPSASNTWEGKTALAANQQETGRIEIPFRGPVRIVAARPTISQRAALTEIAAPTVFNATLDDLEMYLDVSERMRYTSRFDLNRTANSEAGQFVTLSNFVDSIGSARILDIIIRDPAPVIGVNFRWSRPVAGGPFYNDIVIGLALHCYYLADRGES